MLPIKGENGGIMMNKKIAACAAATVFMFGGACFVPGAGSDICITASAETYGDLSYYAVSGGCTIAAYTGEGGEVNIPSEINGLKVVSIDESAFFQCDTLTSLTMPDSVTAIGENAFMNCSSLKSLKLSSSLKEIGACAFTGCTSLKSLTLPDSLSVVGEAAFADCTSLDSLTIPDKNIKFCFEAFMGCKALKNVIIPSGVDVIEEGAFGFTISDGENAEYRYIADFVLNCYMNSKAYIYAVENELAYNILDPDTPDIIYGIPEDDLTTDDENSKGDVSGDGMISVVDISMTAGHVKGIKSLNTKRQKRADANNDSKVTVTDISMIAAHVKGVKTLDTLS